MSSFSTLIVSMLFWGIIDGNKMQEQLMPLVKQLDEVQGMEVPDFGTLASREVETKIMIMNHSKVSY